MLLFLAFLSNLLLYFLVISALLKLYLSLSFFNFSHSLMWCSPSTVITLHLGESPVWVWVVCVPIVWTAVMLLPKIRTIMQLVIWILPLTFVVAYLMDFLSWHLRDFVIPWLMVGSCVHISLCDLIDAPEDVLHGGPRFFFLGNPLSDGVVPESLNES